MVMLRLQSVEDGIVGRLGLGVVVEQQRGLVGAPRLQVIWLVSFFGSFLGEKCQNLRCCR